MADYIDKWQAVANLMDAHLKDTAKAVNAIQYMDVADVRPVVHGKWERKRDKCGSFVSCSVCHTSGWYQFAFCPYCGADMRKEDSVE